MSKKTFHLPDLGEGLPDATIVEWHVKEGDTVVFSKYGGTELKYNGEEYLLLSSRDLLAVIEK